MMTRGPYVNPLQQLAEKPLRRFLVSTALDENIQYVAILIDGPPEIVPCPMDGAKHLVHGPLVTGSGTPAPELMGRGLPELQAPLANRVVGHPDPTDEEPLFDIPLAQPEAVVQPDTVTEHFGGKPMVCVRVGWCRGVHSRSQDGPYV
jgi:hypothetical protein